MHKAFYQILVLGIFFVISMTAFAAKAKLSTADDTQRFIGTWKLVGMMNTDGTTSLMFGKDPLGYIIYTKEGFMSAHLMRKQREKFHSDNLKETTCEEAQKLLSDYYGYSGQFEIDVKRKIVKHHPVIHSLPNSVDKTLERTYRFEGKDRLYLTTIGANPNLILIWQRVK